MVVDTNAVYVQLAPSINLGSSHEADWEPWLAQWHDETSRILWGISHIDIKHITYDVLCIMCSITLIMSVLLPGKVRSTSVPGGPHLVV